MTDDRVLSKLRKLLAKAEGTDNSDEAEVFMAKVREMLVAHQIDISVVREPGEDPDPLAVHEHGLALADEEDWRKVVCHMGAEYFGCRALFADTPSGGHGVALIGRRSARLTCIQMLPHLQREVVRLSDRFGLPVATVGYALAARLRELCQRAPMPSSPGLPVPIDEAQAMVEEMATESRTVDATHSMTARAVAELAGLDLQTTSRAGAAAGQISGGGAR